MATLFTCRTSGKGLWSRSAKTVSITKLDLSIMDWGNHVSGELQAYFKPTSWNTKNNGLIYTDELWIREFREALIANGFSERAVFDVGYSEQGMQTSTYVSMDVGEDFIKECDQFYRFSNGQPTLPNIINIERHVFDHDY
jgi:hypothetical protein